MPTAPSPTGRTGYRDDLCGLAVIVGLLAVLFYPLGLSYTPLNDGWVLVNSALYGEKNFQSVADRILSGEIHGRLLQDVLFSLYALAPTENFAFLKASLYILNGAALFGLFKVLRLFFHPAVSLAAVVVFACFPFDGTPFWIGALLIHLGFALFIWSIYFAFRHFESGGGGRLALACLLVALSNLTYPGYFLLPPALVFLYALAHWRVLRRNLAAYAIFAAAYLLSLWSTVAQMLQSSGRNSKIADLDMLPVLAGFEHAFRTLFVESVHAVASTSWPYPVIAATFSCVAVALGFLAARGRDDRQLRRWRLGSAILFGMFAAVTLLVAGYLPYAITELRFNVDRELMFARLGLVVFAAVLLSLVIPPLQKSTFGRAAGLAAAFVATFLLLNTKLVIADMYGNASLFERRVFAGLAQLVPSYAPGTELLIYFEDSSSILPPARMLVNRPAWPLRYLYDDAELNAVAADDHRLRRFLRYEPETKTLSYGGAGGISTRQLVAVRYSPEDGMAPLTALDVADGTGKIWTVKLPGIENARPAELNSRQQWFVQHQ